MNTIEINKRIMLLIGISGILLSFIGFITSLHLLIDDNLIKAISLSINGLLLIIQSILYISSFKVNKNYERLNLLFTILNGFITLPLLCIICIKYEKFNINIFNYFLIIPLLYGIVCKKKQHLIFPILNLILYTTLYYLTLNKNNNCVYKYNYNISIIIIYLFNFIIPFLLTSFILNKNRILEKISKRDELTTLYNRRCLSEDLSIKNDIKYIFMIDIDNFKKINDIYGHQVGDEALKTLAQIILNHSSDEFLSYRYGGEEIIILSRLSEKETIIQIKKLFDDVRHNFKLKNEQHITISSGLSKVDNNLPDKYEQCIKDADANLYLAKHNGKNNVFYNTKVLY